MNALAELPPRVQKASRQWTRYQRRWFADKCKLKQMVKARRVGGSAAAAANGAYKAIGYDVFTGRLDLSRGENVNIVSAGHSQARKMLSRCVDEIREAGKIPQDIDQAMSLARKYGLEPTLEVIIAICEELRQTRPNAGYIVVPTKRQVKRGDDIVLAESADIVRLACGSGREPVEIRAFAANPRTIRSFEGHVILDEFGVMPFARQIWAAAAPVAQATLGYLAGYSIEIIGTPCGDDNMHFDIAMTDAGKRFSRHKVDIYTAVRDGFPIKKDDGSDGTIEDLKEECGLLEMFEQEYNCVFLSASTRYITAEMLKDALYDATNTRILKDMLDKEPWSATAGLDVANSDKPTADPCALVRNYLIGEHESAAERRGRKGKQVYWLDGDIKGGRGISFATQEMWLAADLESGGGVCYRAGIDRNGLGRDLAERLVKRFGDAILPVDFTPADKEIMATRCKLLFENGRQKIPYHQELQRGLLNLHRIVSADGSKTRYDIKRTTKQGGHGDEAWAMMLSQHAAEMGGLPFVPRKGFMSRAIG